MDICWVRPHVKYPIPLVLGLLFVLAFGACVSSVENTGPTSTPPSAVQPAPTPDATINTGGKRLAAEFQGGGRWLNSEPFTLESRRGKVVLVDFWTYSCINCIRTLPHLKSWHDKYREKGLVIVGVHTPEFRFEEDNAC